jgi:hypothetical protein
MEFIDKAIKGIKITAAILVIVSLLALAYGAYENYRFFKGLAAVPVSDSTDEVIIEWLADYANDKALMEKSNKDIKETIERLEKLGVEFDEENK